jgi:hypothetical protein
MRFEPILGGVSKSIVFLPYLLASNVYKSQKSSLEDIKLNMLGVSAGK